MAERDIPGADLDARLAGARTQASAERRAGAAWERRARQADAVLADRLRDLAEQAAEVTVTTVDGRLHRGTVVGAGPDAVHLRLGAGGPLLVVPRHSLGTVRTGDQRDPSPREERPSPAGSLREALDALAADRVAVVVGTGATEPISATIDFVGHDFVGLSVGDDRIDIPLETLRWVLTR